MRKQHVKETRKQSYIQPMNCRARDGLERIAVKILMTFAVKEKSLDKESYGR